MSIINALKLKSDVLYPYLNTLSPLDIATGNFELGVHGEWILNGGIGPITTFSGRSGFYKSTIVDSLMVNLLMIYPRVEVVKYDTESTSTSIVRYERMADGRVENISERIVIWNRANTSFEKYCKMIEDIGKYKLANEKAYTVPIPFLNPNDSTPMSMLIPTLVDVDSFSELITDTSVTALNKEGIDSSKNNTLDMFEGRIKKRLMSSMVVWAKKFGMYFFLTAHVGTKKQLDQYHPDPKQNQWLSANDKIKSVGANFEFLPNVAFQCLQPIPMKDKDTKLAIYPSEQDHGATKEDPDALDINRTGLKMLRCKTNLTGLTIPLVMSQHRGILPELSCYEYLMDAQNYGMTMKGYNRYLTMKPDIALHRKSIRTTVKDNYEIRRALELTQQLHWINTYWNKSFYPFHIPETVDGLVERIDACPSLTLSEVLNSRGYWTYNEKDERPYLSIMDICSRVDTCVPQAQVPDTVVQSLQDEIPVEKLSHSKGKGKKKDEDSQIEDMIRQMNGGVLPK